MREYQSLCHTKWDCKYHVVFIPKRRKKMIFGAIRKHLGEILRELALMLHQQRRWKFPTQTRLQLALQYVPELLLSQFASNHTCGTKEPLNN